MNNNSSRKFPGGKAVRSITRGLLVAFGVLAASGIASVQEKTDEITFNLLPNPAVVDCLRANPYEEPRARATVIRGRQNDTLILVCCPVSSFAVLNTLSRIPANDWQRRVGPNIFGTPH